MGVQALGYNNLDDFLTALEELKLSEGTLDVIRGSFKYHGLEGVEAAILGIRNSLDV